MGIEKTYGLIMRKYYWPKLLNDVVDHVKKCVMCQVQSRGSKAALVLMTDIPHYPFQKISLDISSPYGPKDKGNCYILSFVDWLTGWPEAFAIPDKRAQTVSDIIISEIFPRYGAPEQLVTDNGSENVNEVMRETLGELNIQHITTSPYNPQSNAKVEIFRKTLADVLAKLAEHNGGNSNLFLTQALATVRFSMNEMTKFSPYYFVYGRDVVLPIDNLLRPGRKYLGEDHHRIILEQLHKIFTQVRRRIRRAQKRRNDRINRNREEVSFKIGDPVYYKIHLRDGKLDQRWGPYYRIVEQTGPGVLCDMGPINGQGQESTRK